MTVTTRLGELASPALAGTRSVLALPVGSCEQHGPHLPVGVDTIINEGYLARAMPLVPEELDVLVSCSITKYRGGLVQRIEPAMSVAIAQTIGATNAMTFDVSNACAGTLTGVFIVNNMIRRGVVRKGLVVSGEYISQLGHNAARHVRSVLSRELASLTLGDAGVAALLADAACRGAAYNVRINVAAMEEKSAGVPLVEEARSLVARTAELSSRAQAAVERAIGD